MSSITIKDIPTSERPRERLLEFGKENLSNEDLLAIILKTGTKNLSAKDLSIKLMATVNDFFRLKDISYNQLIDIKGIGSAKAIEFLATIELGKRLYIQNNSFNNIQVKNSKDIFNYIKSYIIDKKQEYFFGIYLDTKKKIIGKKLLFIGSLNRSVVHPREIFKEAYLLSASSLVCVHNHPSGDVKPSIEDKEITIIIKKISVIQGIELVDHVIVSESNYFSFYENGLI